MTFTFNIPGQPMASFVISIILSGLLTGIVCYGLFLFFRRTGNETFASFVWVVPVGIMLNYSLGFFGHGNLASFVKLLLAVLMIFIFIKLREPLHMINRTGWSRLWLFIPIVNLVMPYLWAREAD
jgi:hypothetical protein